MPPIRGQNSRNSIEQEGRILLAIQSFQNKEIPTILEAARRFLVPNTTLQRRIDGHLFRPETRANSHKLTPEEERSLLRWILSMDTRGSAPRPSMVREMANILLGERSNETVGRNWATSYIKRYPELKSRSSRRYD